MRLRLLGDPIKNKWFNEGFRSAAVLSLVTPNKQSLEVRPTEVRLEPRGELGKLINQGSPVKADGGLRPFHMSGFRGPLERMALSLR
jgi:hypothetical protein